ncbi:MAG TPA: serine hydrolase, partial [Pseudonocardiaceae bacterium]
RHGRAPQLPPATSGRDSFAGLGGGDQHTTVTESGPAPLTPVLRRFLARQVDHDRQHQAMVLTWHQAPDPALLEQALCAVVGHHEGLRLRLGDDGLLVGAGGVALRVVADLDLAAEEIDVDMRLAGPLLHAALSGRRLLLVAHHVATDVVSWSILLDDIATAYRAVETGAQIVLPPVRTTYRQWATRLAEYARSDRMLDDSAFWLAHRPVPRGLPLDSPEGSDTEASRAVVETTLPTALNETLHHRAPRVLGSRVDEVLLWAVARAVTHWTGGTDTVVDLESHGRAPLFDDVDLGRTVGWCTSVYPVHLHVSGEDPVRGLAAVRDQLRAVPHRGIGYGIARYLREDTGAALADRPPAQVAFTYQDSGNHLASRQFDASFDAPGGTRAAENVREHVIAVDAAVVAGEIVLRWTYSTALHRRETIERIARHCLAELADLATRAAEVRDAERRPVERVFRHAPALIVPMVRHHVRGVSVALIEDGEVTDTWGEGVTGGPRSTEVGPHTVFLSCSVSKHVATLGVLRLVQDGTLDLDEDVSRYLRTWELPAGPGRITVRQLLGHTAGLVSLGYHECSRDGSITTLAPMLAKIGRDHAPGDHFEYSGVNFAVLQRIVEDTEGRPFADVLRSLVLEPLGMRDSGYGQDFLAGHVDVAHGHLTDGSPDPVGLPVVPDMGSSGLWSTAGDLAKVDREIFAAATGGRPVFLDHDLATEMITPKHGDYALGTATSPGRDAYWFGHPGDRYAYQGFTAVDLRTGAGLVMLANIGGDVPFLGNVVNELDLDIHYKIR